MKDSGSSHLVPLIDCTKVDGDSDFDIIKKKQGGERQRNRQIQPEPCQRGYTRAKKEMVL